ncbi:MAG: multidrug effflux MFS transporter [Pseudomonadota bacterium]
MKPFTAVHPGPYVPFILAACTAVSVLSTDLITPSIPDLPASLNTDISTAQMTVSVNLFAYAIAQLVHGPVADAIGRKRLLITAFVLFAAFSVYCALAVSMQGLLWGRFLQGLVSSVPSVVIVLIIRELYDSNRALAVMGLYGATLGVAPAIGPLIGGYLHFWFGWQAGFWFVAIVALIVAALVSRNVPESLTVPARLNLAQALRTYGRLLMNKQFLVPMAGVSMCFSAFYAYVTSASAIFIDLLGMPVQHYGLTNLVIIGAFVVGNLVSARLSRHYGAEQMLRIGAMGMIVAVVGLLVPIVAGTTAILPIVIAMSLYGACLAIILAAGPLVVLNAAVDAPSGPAAALLGSFQLGMAAVAGYLAAEFYNETAIPMALVMTLLVLSGAGLLLRRHPAIVVDV